MTAGATAQEPYGISLIGLLKDAWRLRVAVVCVWIASGVCGVVYALTATEWYRADVVVVQADGRQSSVSGLGQLGGLASLAGISLPTGGSPQTSLAVLRSNDFARSFIEKRGLAPILLAASPSPGAANGKARKAPDLIEAMKYFNESVRIVAEDKRTGLVNVGIRWRDPEQAATWANLLVQDVNVRLREQALREAEAAIKYLKAEVAATSVTAMQQSLSKLLEAEMQKLLLAKGNEEFAFKVIDQAIAPTQRESPKRRLIVAGSLVAGFFASLLLVVAYRIRREFLLV